MSLELGRGELVALVGENGAGKSTLMNVLSGLYRPDSGEVRIDGAPVTFRGPRDAICRGIGMVHQHFMLVPPLTVAENVVLGREPTRRGLLDLDAAVAQVAETCRRFGFQLDPRARVEELSVGSQQKVEIVKALHRGAQVLILDEPTAVLTPQEADELIGVARKLAADGHTVVFISHKLREVLSVAERIVVLRRGRKVAEVRASETTVERLAEQMIGEVRGTEAVSTAGAPSPTDGSEPAGESAGSSTGRIALQVEQLDDGAAVHGVSLTIRAGELVGIAGVDGNGQRELAEILTGLRRATGSMTLLGRELLGASPGELRARGVGHVPEDRLLRAIIGPMSVEENLALGRHLQPPFARGARIDFQRRRAHAVKLLEDYDVRPRDPTLRIATLSGGNQQKAVLARELDAGPTVLIVVQPTRGLDIAAVRAVHQRLRAHRDRGAAILLISLDLEEVLTLSDRVYVMFDGRITGELERADFDERRIGRLMLGAQAEAPAGAPP